MQNNDSNVQPTSESLPIGNAVLSDALSFSEMKVVSHSLGVDLFKAVMSLKLKDKRLPKSFYRNYYNASKRQATIAGIDELVSNGFMGTRQKEYYFVTKKGIEQFKKQFLEMAIYKPLNVIDLEYLRHRINFYCDFYNYNFCNDNSKHIFEYARKYFIDKDYVSHTTKDVILRFKTELKKLVKTGAA